MNSRVFIAELLQDLPLWVALVMSIYPEYQKEELFYIALGIGTGATLFIFREMKSGNYSFETLFSKPSEAVPFLIYSFLLLIILIVLTFQDRLYMGSILWLYIIAGSLGEIFLMRRN
ncbi:hypothetical protein GWK41_03470 [Persephonella atlantica]|uniref:Uncharacterized protein n=1 Tax=Persephonella atlantica TaxID=2699429 RepID=A0ABS1GGW9_9AQUI|nr:hypothetical protein [Persephonella atlantica]MBK3332126.1 hypothetical protein [Persephonella atlantica]